MSAPRILVTCPPMLRLMDEFDDDFRAAGLEGVPAEVTQTLSEDELCDLVPGFDGWIIGDDPATARVVEAARAGSLRAAVKWGVGVDNVDFVAFEAAGVPVTNTPGVFGREVADVAAGYVLGLARDLFVIDRGIRAGGWPKPAGQSLWNKTAGVVGFGDIGKETCRRLRAFGMEVIAYDPAFAPADGIEVTPAAWPDRVGDLDYLVFTAPLNEATRGMFDEALLERLKDGVHVVNVARGPIIREAALLDGLRSGKVAAAALDVFEDEPLAADNPLRGFERCIFGSHNGSNTKDAVRRVSRKAIGLIADYLRD